MTVNDKDKANVKMTNTHEPAFDRDESYEEMGRCHDQDGLRPKSIKVFNSMLVMKSRRSTELSADNQWTHTFNKLAESRSSLSATVEEVAVPEDYQVTADSL